MGGNEGFYINILTILYRGVESQTECDMLTNTHLALYLVDQNCGKWTFIFGVIVEIATDMPVPARLPSHAPPLNFHSLELS